METPEAINQRELVKRRTEPQNDSYITDLETFQRQLDEADSRENERKWWFLVKLVIALFIGLVLSPYYLLRWLYNSLRGRL